MISGRFNIYFLNICARANKKKSLDAFAILSLPARLRKTALELHRVGRATAAMIAKVTGESEDIEKEYLDELFTMGYLVKEEKDRELYFIF